MAEIPPNQGSKALKITLIVAAILFGLCVVCGGAFYLFVGKDVMGLALPFAGLQSAAAAKYPQGAGITLTGESAEDFTLALGVRDGLPPEERAAAQDWLWKQYVEAFADGGFPVKYIAVGKWRGGSNVAWGTDDEVDVETVAARTGIAPPPVNEFLAKQMPKTGSGRVTVGPGGSSADDTPKKDDGNAPDEQK